MVRWCAAGIVIIAVLGSPFATGQAINITAAQSNGDVTHTRTVVKVELTWSEAAKYCTDSNLGELFPGTGTYNILDLRHYLHTTYNPWPHGKDLWLGLVKLENDTVWYTPKCDIYENHKLPNIVHTSTLCTGLNMTVDSSKFQPDLISCLEKRFFVCTSQTGVHTDDTYYNKTLFDHGGLNVVSSKKYNTTKTSCSKSLKQYFKTFLVIYDKNEKSCASYSTNPVYFLRSYQLITTSDNNVVFVKTSGNNYPVTDSLTVPVDQQTMACVPNLNDDPAMQSTSTAVPASDGTVTKTGEVLTLSSIHTSTNTTLCTCYPSSPTIPSNFDSLVNSLRISRKVLSSYRRGRISVSDDRTSCRVLGYVAAIVIFGSCTCIIIMDIPIILKLFKHKHTIRW